VPGAWILELARQEDERGYFARTWCRRQFEEHGLVADLVQANLSHSARQGTIRGMHYQVAPFQETKVVSCLRGAIWDVIIDLRPDSPAYLEWFGVELSADNRRQIYVPEGCAHGYQTLVNDTDVFYHVSAFYAPECERGIRWNDPRFAIRWPQPSGPTLSRKDQEWPDFRPQVTAPEGSRLTGLRCTP
jgi:dTDP-4-dehydrorhamnose 3,5-epimerase